MMTYATYFWSVLMFLLIVGAILFVLDHAMGVRFRQFIWRLTHDKRAKVPDHLHHGFIYGRHIKSRAKVAAFVMLIETALTIMFTPGVNPFIELVTAIIDIPILLLGFYMGPALEEVLRLVGLTLDKVEEVEKRIERGETSIGGEFTSVVDGTRLKIRARVDEYAGVPRSNPGPSVPPPVTTPPAPVAPEPDPTDGLNSFIGRSTEKGN